MEMVRSSTAVILSRNVRADITICGKLLSRPGGFPELLATLVSGVLGACALSTGPLWLTLGLAGAHATTNIQKVVNNQLARLRTDMSDSFPNNITHEARLRGDPCILG